MGTVLPDDTGIGCFRIRRDAGGRHLVRVPGGEADPQDQDSVQQARRESGPG